MSALDRAAWDEEWRIAPGVRVQVIYHLLKSAEVEVVALCRKQPRPAGPLQRSGDADRRGCRNDAAQAQQL
jgi:hypothetical protein